jgi:4-hydroxyacetophenone monooxygenase
VVPLLETQVRYVCGLLARVLATEPERMAIEVRTDVFRDFNARVQAAHDRMIWSHKGMSNWYRNDQGKIVATMPFRNDDYWRMLRETRIDDFDVRVVERAAGRS